MRVSYSDGYFVPLPEGHPFPMAKFPALHRILLREGLIGNGDRAEPSPAGREVLRLVHTDRYLDELRTGLERGAERRLGLPWSEALERRSRLAVGGTVLAARMALEDGIAANLAGGTHHAYPDHGEGFCVLNDVAVAIRLLRGEGLLDRALVIDLDVHQGNGTCGGLRRRSPDLHPLLPRAAELPLPEGGLLPRRRPPRRYGRRRLSRAADGRPCRECSSPLGRT